MQYPLEKVNLTCFLQWGYDQKLHPTRIKGSKMKRLLFLLSVILPIMAQSASVQIDGINYELKESKKTAIMLPEKSMNIKEAKEQDFDAAYKDLLDSLITRAIKNYKNKAKEWEKG